jgi:uncharacterized membrane protein YhaH (DUF805 family)
MDTDIAAVVGFNADELSLNRAGKLSDRQRSFLQRARKGGRRYGWFIIGVLVVFVVLIVVLLLPKLTKEQKGSGEDVPIVPIVLGVLAFVVLVMVLSFLRSRRRLDRLASGRVLTVTGPARGRARRMHGNIESDIEYGGGTRYELTIGSTTFFVAGQRVLDAFATGGVYRAYYAAGGGHAVMNRLLSAERVG